MRFLEKHHYLWLLILFMTINSESTPSAEEGVEEESLFKTFRFHRPPRERTCQYRRFEGTCKRRSECRRPSRYICRYGADPIICCLDKDETTTTTTTTTRAPIRTSRPRRPVKPENNENIDLTFPGCGIRSPKVLGEDIETSRTGSIFSRRMGPFSRLGKREINPHFHIKRIKRWGPIIRPVVVGGQEARSNSWPWMVAIFKKASSGGTKRFLCGASLISRQYVLTAAHCFDGEKRNIDATKFVVVVGSHTTKDGTEYNIKNVLIHPNYQKKQYYNDICLMKLTRHAQLTKKVHPVCLPSDGLRNKIIPGDSNVTVTGWGDTTFGGVSSQVLQEVNMPIVPLKDCNESYSKVAKSSFPKGITNLFICAGEREGGKDACQGDSGGPLVTRLKGEAWVQLGVVSFGFGCAQPGFPGVYTRLSQYTKWLYENTDLG